MTRKYQWATALAFAENDLHKFELAYVQTYRSEAACKRFVAHETLFAPEMRYFIFTHDELSDIEVEAEELKEKLNYGKKTK